MKKHKSEDIYRHIAKEYTEYAGQKLSQEKESLPPEQKDSITRLDDLVTRRIKFLKKQKMIHLTGFAAACLLLILLFPVFRYIQRDDGKSGNTASDSAAHEPPKEEVIPLSFSLPDNFEVAQTEIDQGVSIYYLNNTYDDPVVMQMEYMDTAEPVFNHLQPVHIKGRPAYGLAAADYKILTFVHDNILYTLTCEYDINTLVSISENIF